MKVLIAAVAVMATAAAASAQTVGIQACDDFIAKYETCVAKFVPADQRAEYDANIANWRQEWSAAAQDANNKLILTGVCNQMQEQSKATFEPLGCAF